MLAPWKKSYYKPIQHIKKPRHYFANESPYSQRYSFSNSHVWVWELDHKESWGPKNWCFQTVVLEKTLENLLDCKEIKPVNPKWKQSWIFTGRTDAEVEAPKHWPPDAKSWSFENTLMLGKIEGRRKGHDRGWNGWMASPTQWTWVWANSGRWWWIGNPGVLQSMGSQRVRHDWVTEQQQQHLSKDGQRDVHKQMNTADLFRYCHVL